MAKVKYTAHLGEYGDLASLFTSVSNLELTTDTAQKAVYRDSVNSNKIILVGNNFTYDGEEMTGGTIRSIVFADEDNKRFATVLHGNWDPQELLTAYAVDGFDGMEEFVLKGRDKFTGSGLGDAIHSGAGGDRVIGGKGMDRLFAETGNDKLTGGKGSDTFFFYPGDGHDVITDFDAKGGGLKQDYLGIEPLHTFEEVLTSKGLRLDFDSGDSLLLLGVSKIDDSDFAVFS